MYRDHFSTKKTPQSEPVPGKEQVKNYAGGYVFELDPWQYLDRFLIIGTEGGTYYASEKTLTVKACNNVLNCIKEDGVRVVNRITEISDQGRAPKNDPALFALAMCISLGDAPTKQAAAEALPKIARIGTHLFHFVNYCEGFRGWGKTLKTAIKNWYHQDTEKLIYQAVKYQSRDGWSHRDLLRLSHPKPTTPRENAIYGWIVGKPCNGLDGTLIEGFERAKKAETKEEIVRLIDEYQLTHEMIPTEYKNSSEVQWALLQNMPYTAMLRNLGNFGKSELLKQGKWDVVEFIENVITDVHRIQKSRVHPINILLALKTYASGEGYRGSGRWHVVPSIVSALDQAFYGSFKFLEPTGKRHYIALDCSGSMSWTSIKNSNLEVIEAACAMAMTRYKVEKKTVFKGFAGHMKELGITTQDTLDVARQKALNMNFGSTDCALPMIDALQNEIEIDLFEIYTDNETWVGHIHPFQALQNYRNKMGIPAKLVVWGMTATDFSIADPRDPAMLDVVGFDTATPQIVNEFVR